ncbi:hypothetical protein C8J56DRAFT_1038764 [Mycena floridula]|nr:hypothetical protein C8J56DRAFT_1038764 [Mycena floridula]
MSVVRALKPRTLVLCFDGTMDEYSAKNTNVVKLFALLKKDNFEEQLCYYQASKLDPFDEKEAEILFSPGIGTFFEPGVVAPIFEWGAKILDEAVAWYLSHHVMDAYRFIMDAYRSGDKICLFGFSRGAYTALALAGMLYTVGLLPRGNHQQIPFAFKMYKHDDDALAAGFKERFSQDVKVEFLGVWDTVCSVGVVGKCLPFTSSNNAIKTFRHALALDERRTRFRPNLYHRPSSPSPRKRSSLSEKSRQVFRRLSIHRYSEETDDSFVVVNEPEEVSGSPDVLEVWFSGGHCDVGGGSVPDTTSQNLANIPLRWMVREIIASECGVLFIWMLSTHCYVLPILKSNKWWWILEVLPLKYRWQDPQGVRKSSSRYRLFTLLALQLDMLLQAKPRKWKKNQRP